MSEDPLTNPEKIWYSDGSSFVLDGKGRAGYAVVSNFETIEAKPLPPGTSAQLTELIALTRALELGKGKRIAIYTDSKYAFLVLHAAIWKERGHLTTQGSPIKYSDQILRLLEAVHLPSGRFESPTVQFSSVQFSHLVMSSSLQPHESQHAAGVLP